MYTVMANPIAVEFACVLKRQTARFEDQQCSLSANDVGAYSH